MSISKKRPKRKQKKGMRLRVIPLTMYVASLLLLLKASETVQGGIRISSLFYSTAIAEDKPAPEEKKEEPKKEEEGKKEEPVEEGHKEASAEEKPEEGEGHGEEKKEEFPPNVSLTPPPTMGDSGLREGDRRFSPEEVKLLEQLSKRRAELEQWESNIQVKEGLLTITEKRVDEKLAQIEELKAELTNLLTQYNEQENAKIKSLVKIYENMKPRDAAGIFDEVEMPILLLIIDQMSEKKAAPILAAMDPKKAKQLTVELAEQRRAQSQKLKRAAQATAPAAGAAPGTAKPASPPPVAPAQ